MRIFLFALLPLAAAPLVGAAWLAGSPAGPQSAAVAAEIEQKPSCRLEDRGGTRVLHLVGNPGERAFAEGELLADEIFACFDEFAIGHVAAGKPALWQAAIRPLVKARFEFPKATHDWAAGVVRGMVESRKARGKSMEVEGLGRDLDALDILCFTAIPDLAGVMCSSLAVWDDASKTGDLLVARNLDYPSTPAIRQHSIVKVHARSTDADGTELHPARITIGWPGLGGCLTGLTEHGVFGAVHDVYSDEDFPRDTRATPRVIAMEQLLRETRPSADAGADAEALLEQHRFFIGGNFMLAWQGSEARGAAVLELGRDPKPGGSTTLRLPAKGASAIACSNHHRLRDKSDLGCDRYQGLIEGAGDAKIGREALWALIDEAGMSITLYRCAADLGSLELTVQRKTDEGWQARETFDFED